MAGGGGTEPNLTPFIDLFSVLICFLLMTAAWLQLESLQVQVEKAPSNAASPDPVAELEKPKEKKVKLSMKMYGDHVVASEDEKEVASINQAGDINKAQVASFLSGWKRKFPDRKDIVLNSDSSVTYGQLIRFYDLLVAEDWTDVGINPY